MKENDIRFAKLLVLVNGAVPLALLGWDAVRTTSSGPTRSNFAILTTGMMTLVFLMLTLAGDAAAQNHRLELADLLPAHARALRLLLRLPALPDFLQPGPVVQRFQHVVGNGQTQIPDRGQHRVCWSWCRWPSPPPTP